MFSAFLPNFLSNWELPSLSAYTSLSAALQRRVLSFLLRSIIGHLVKEGQLDWNQIEAGIVAGTLEIRDVELEPEVINAFLVDSPVHVTSARLAKIALQIPWTNFWSGHVVITVHQPLVHIASGPPPSRQSPDALADSLLSSSGLSQSLTDVAGSLLHQDPEGRSLEQSLQDSLQLSDDPQPASSQDQAGTIAASLVEALLLRLKIESRDAQVLLYKDGRQSQPDFRLTVGHVSVHTETQETAPTPPETHTIRDKTRSILVQDVDLWSVQSPPTSSHHPSPSSSTSSLDDDPEDILAMSQAVDNLAASALSGAESMYHSAIAEDQQKPDDPAPPPASSSSPTFRRLLSLGTDPLQIRLNTKKRVSTPTPRPSSSSDAPLGSLPDAPQQTKEHEPASASLQLTLGSIVCFLGDEDACNAWAFIQTILEAFPQSAASAQPISSKTQPAQKIDFSVNVPAIHFLTAYQPRTELTEHQTVALEDTLTSLWTRPTRTNPPIGHLRLKVDAFRISGHVRGQERAFAVDATHIALFEHLPPTRATSGYYAPILVFDENLATASTATSSVTAPPSSSDSTPQLFDWRSSDARAASSNGAAWGPYQRTGILDKAWKLKSRHRREPSSASAATSAEPSRSAIHLSFESESINVTTQPLHLFADLSAANRVVPFLHRLASAPHSSARSPDSMVSSVDTLSAQNDNVSPGQVPDDQRLPLRVNLPLVRAELRVPSEPTQHDVQEGLTGLRSGLLALDLADLTLSQEEARSVTSTPQPPAAPTMGQPRRTRFHADPTAPLSESEEDAQMQVSVRQASLLFQPVSAASATCAAVLTSLSNDEDVSASGADEPTALRPRLVFLRPGTQSSSASLTIARIPLIRLLLTKAVVDGLQLLADDAGTWARQLSRIGESSQDEQDGMRVLGSRFFGSGSKAGLSAISGSESAATIEGDKGSHEARATSTASSASSAVTVEITEIAGDVLVPRQHIDTDLGASPDRLLTIKAQDLRTIFDPQHGKNTASLDLTVMTLSAFEGDNKEGSLKPLLAATLPQSLSRGAAPMLSLQMLLYADPDSPHRESKIEPVIRGMTFTLTDDHQLLSDLAAFAKSPQGAFENVEPNEVTRLNLKIASSSLHLAPSIIDDRAALSIGDLTIKSRLVGDSPRSVFTVALLDTFLYVVDKPMAIAPERQRRIRAPNDHWASQGYAKVADLKDVQGGLTTSRLTLPELELRITRVRGHLEACADTLEAVGRLIPAIMPKQEEPDHPSSPRRSRSQTIDSELSDNESLTTSSASRNLLSSVDEDAFRAAPTMDSIPDMLDDDIPSRPDFFGQPEMRGEQSQQQQQQYGQGRNSPQASDFETLPLSEEDFFGQETVASLVEPRQKQPRHGSPQRKNEQVLLQSDVVTVRLLDPRGVRPTMGYFSNPDLAPKKRSITGDFASAFRLRVEDCDIALKLYGGYDWKVTRSEIEEEIKRVRKRLQKIKQLLAEGQEPDDSVEEVAQDLFESVYIAVDAEADASAAMSALDDELGLQSETASSASTWQPLPRGQSGAASSHRTAASVGAFAAPRRRTKLERSTQSMIDLVFKGINVEYDSLVAGAPLASSLGVTIRAVQILDNIKTSTWHAFLTEMKVKGAQRRADASMVKVQLLTVRPQSHLRSRSRRSSDDQASSDRQELRVRAKISPLRLHVDQDALDFFKKFFAFKRPSEAVKVGESADAPEPSTPSDPFIQYAEVLPIKLKLDYKPKRVDYGLLRKGRTIEMMNFFHFDSAEMTLRHLTLRGITGWPRLFDTLNDIWTPDVKANQLADVLSGIAPVRSIVNVGAGVADLILLPIEQYQKDGKIVKGVRRGASRFARVTALEALKLGARLATGTQAVLEKAESALVGTSAAATTLASASAPQTTSRPRPTRHASDDAFESDLEDDNDNTASASSSAASTTPYTLPLIDDEEHAALISKYADQPNGLSEALSQAYKGLRGGMNSAAQTILAVPMEVYEHGGGSAGSGQRKVVKAVPVAVLQGARGASEAISKTLMGLRGALEPLGEDEMEKYKRQVSGTSAGDSSGSSRRRT